MNKILLISTFLFIFSTNTFSQTKTISISTLEQISRMSSSEFEDWALDKGLKFSGAKEYSTFNTLSYGIKNTYSITILIDKEGTSRGNVQYATNSNLNYINIKKNCTKIGYNFITSEYENNDDDGEKKLFHKYESKNNELTFYTSYGNNVFNFNICLNNKNIR
ncbi:hypothetical protein [Flavobacterium psychrophilum]|uniref:hypothetical protein n=1 Tax=Flavobacterium psychrophilum TaxID=96345 RepID=UPI0015E594BC|nr:hypothetical protein [Flavobacterium psychrophilum]MBM4676917.1 hypothetical protein [Flavobacterium psychrophilum]MCB6062532.1 hypothetical protein [Flavobacterium psychrophilum]QLL30186.1 hypothetical protein E5165_12660 [Flavobacterium psychrophilum]UOP30840.1 hypothetical protein MUG67_01120 [Flavobacterium psychrophilum]UOP33264.1 hypothetical protein MUG74_01125 [Flavobacterium psychrophilum]